MQIKGVILTEPVQHNDPRGWLAEVWRSDETAHLPAMGYVSLTNPGITRGPHEHREQADYFVFLSGEWRVILWDNRVGHQYKIPPKLQTINITKPVSLIVPPGVVHSYQNVGSSGGLVLNLPDRLYGGHGRLEAVDEIRHEGDDNSAFNMFHSRS